MESAIENHHEVDGSHEECRGTKARKLPTAIEGHPLRLEVQVLTRKDAMPRRLSQPIALS
jgi:hypothetical protein